MCALSPEARPVARPAATTATASPPTKIVPVAACPSLPSALSAAMTALVVSPTPETDHSDTAAPADVSNTTPAVGNPCVVLEVEACEAAKPRWLPDMVRALTSGARSDALYAAVSDCRDIAKPPCLAFRSKQPRLPDLFALGGGLRGKVLSTVGRGAFGHVVLAEVERRGGGEQLALKVDAEHCSVVWEAFVHRTVVDRLRRRQRTQGDESPSDLLGAYQEHLLPPCSLTLFRDCAMLGMPFAGLGTLVDVLRVLAAPTGGFSPPQLELLACHISQQMVDAVAVLHAADMLHGDIKTDNWVLQRTASGGFSVRLIDLGKAKTATAAVSPQALEALPAGSSELLAALYSASADDPRTAVCYCGSSGVKGYALSEEVARWSFAADYHSLAACAHQLLYLQELATMRVPVEEALRLGYCSEGAQGETSAVAVCIPTSRLKRYMDRQCWGGLFRCLLNVPPLPGAQVDLRALSNSLQRLLSAAPPSARQAAASKLVQLLQT